MAEKDFNKINQAPQAKDDLFTGTQNNGVLLDVMANDLGGNGKNLYSLNQTDPNVVSASATTSLGATVTMVNGKVQYSTSSSAITALGAGQTATDTFYYTIQMGNNGELSLAAVSVTVTGTNDAPVVSGVVTGAAVEDGAPVVLNGLARASDVDAGTTLTVVGVPTTLPPGVTFAANSFSLNPANAAYQSLAAGQTTTVTVAYGVSDGAATVPATVSWTVTGTNDAPVVSGAVTGSAVEGGPASILNGLANASDVDTGATLSVTIPPGALPTGVTFNPATNSFVLNPAHFAFNYLAVGQTTTVTVNYLVSDGITETPAQLSWTLTGTNDAPTALFDTFVTPEDTAVTVNVLGNDIDLDQGAVLNVTHVNGVAVTSGGTVGVGNGANVRLNADNTLTYTPGLNDNGLRNFNYTVTDQHGATSTTAVNGTVTPVNDAPVANPDAGAGFEDDTGITINVLGNDTDVDGGDTKTLVSVTNGAHGTVTANANGTVTFNMPAAAQSLSAGEIGTDTFTYTMKDSAGATSTATVTVTVTGTNDTPSVVAASTVATGSVTELADGAPGEGATGHSVTGTIAIADPDDEDVHIVTSVTPGAPGQLGFFQFQPDPANDRINWTFNVADGALDQLAAGQVKVQTYTVGISDGQGGTTSQVLTITLTGQNDAPFIHPLPAFNFTEFPGTNGPGNQGFTNAGVGFADPDRTDVHSVSVGAPTITLAGAGAVPAATTTALNSAFSASISADSTGVQNGSGMIGMQFSLPDKLLDFLTGGQLMTVTYNLTITDGQGGSFTRPIIFNITGSNDLPNLSGPVTGSAVENGAAVTLNALAGASDADAGAVLTVTGVPGALPQGVSFNAAANTFTLDPNNAAFNYLALGQTADVGVTYQVSDGVNNVTQQARWTVTGVNDAPTASNDAFTTAEDTPITFDVRGNDTDLDQGAVLGVTRVNNSAIGVNGTVAVGNGGVVRLNGDGTLTYTPGLNDNGGRSFTYTVSDQHGATSNATVNGAVTPVNDAPVAVDDPNIKASLVNNSDFGANLNGWTVNNGPTSANVSNYSGSATWLSAFDGHQGVVRMQLSGTVSPGGSGYGPTIRSDNFTAAAGDTVNFDWRLASGGDWALGNGYIKNAATGQIVATVFNFNQGQSGDTGWRHTDVTLATGGSFYMEFQVGSYDSTFGTVIGATMYLDFAGVLPQITEDLVLTINGSELLSNDTDIDSTGLTIASVLGVSDLGATVVLNANGTISYDPRVALNHLNTGQSVVDGITYTVRDPAGATDVGRATFTVQGRNEPQMVQHLANNSFEGGSLSSTSIPGWTNQGGTFLEIVDTTFLGIGGDGHMLDTQGTPGGVKISQSVDLATGSAATLSVSVAKELTGAGLHPGSTLTFEFNGQVVLSITEADFANWNQLKTFSVNVTGQAGADTLTVYDNGTGSVGYALDWVKLEGWVF